MDHVEIKDAIIKSQHCQRNWDLDQTIPEEDLNLIVLAATQCPSKQNLAFYRCHFIQNRKIIEKINKSTYSTGTKLHTNSQTLANLVVVFEGYQDITLHNLEDRNEQTKKITNPSEILTLRDDQHQAIGIAAGYINMVASLLGYSTGCCKCMDSEKVRTILSIEGSPKLIMGIGHKDKSRNRRIHHSENFIFPTYKKQEIPVEWWN